jgi:hypothetical protein
MRKASNLATPPYRYPLMVAALFATIFLFVCPSGASADEGAATARRGNEMVHENAAPPATPGAVAQAPPKGPPSPANRDPTKIQQEFESRMIEVEPPEIRITGVVSVEGRKAAIAELNLEEFEGMVMLEPGMNVSIPKPNRGESESKRWMTFFKVTDIFETGVLLVMENGERIWIPVMGEKD